MYLLSLTVSEVSGDLRRKSQMFPSVYVSFPLRGSSWNFVTAPALKKLLYDAANDFHFCQGGYVLSGVSLSVNRITQRVDGFDKMFRRDVVM